MNYGGQLLFTQLCRTASLGYPTSLMEKLGPTGTISALPIPYCSQRDQKTRTSREYQDGLQPNMAFHWRPLLAPLLSVLTTSDTSPIVAGNGFQLGQHADNCQRYIATFASHEDSAVHKRIDCVAEISAWMT